MTEEFSFFENPGMFSPGPVQTVKTKGLVNLLISYPILVLKLVPKPGDSNNCIVIDICDPVGSSSRSDLFYRVLDEIGFHRVKLPDRIRFEKVRFQGA